MSSRLAVFMAYKYYTNLFKKIKKCKPEILMHKRISVSNARKVYLFGEMILFKNLNYKINLKSMKKLVLVFYCFAVFINAQSLVELRGYLQKGENSEE